MKISEKAKKARKINKKESFSGNYFITLYLIILLVIIFSGIYVALTSFIFNNWFKKFLVYAQIGNFSPYFFTLATVIALFAAILLYRSIKFGLTSLRLLFLSLLSASLSYFFGWANWNPSGSIPLTAFFELQLLMSTMSLVFLFIHFELNEREKPRSWLTAIISLCLVPFSLKNLYSLITGDYHAYTTFEFYLRTLVQIGAVIIFVLAFLTSFRIFKALAHHSNKGKLLGGMQFAGILLLLINVVFEFTEGILELLGSNISTYNTPLFVIAMLLISIPYFINPDLITLVPPNV
ncbi:MAG: hypothetical protein GF317_18310, partial [Candidatus Lokiarchaeota archaeon]|nr:hypothetical protein [Candidatus Lokiarchaeota archaeon]MBD3201468.1 hypothetical protein [Candidatus Lokiarchaeota archaeon]